MRQHLSVSIVLAALLLVGCHFPKPTATLTQPDSVVKNHSITPSTIKVGGKIIRLHTPDGRAISGLEVLVDGKPYAIGTDGSLAVADTVLRTALAHGGVIMVAPGFAPRALSAGALGTDGGLDASLDPLTPALNVPVPPPGGGDIEIPNSGVTVSLPAGTSGLVVSIYRPALEHLDPAAAATERAKLLAAAAGAGAACDRPLPCPPPLGAEGLALSFTGAVPIGQPIVVTYDLDAWLRGWDGKDPAPWTLNPVAWTPVQIQRAKEAARILATFAAIDSQGPATLRDALASQFGLSLNGTQLSFTVVATSSQTSVVDVLGSSLLGVRIEVTLTAGGTGTGGNGTGIGGTGTGGTGTGGTGTGGTGTGGTGTGGNGTGGNGTGGNGTGGNGTGGNGTGGNGNGGPVITPPSVDPNVPTLLEPPIDAPSIVFPPGGAAPLIGAKPDDTPFVMAPIPAALVSLYGSQLLNTYGSKIVSNNSGSIISDQASGIIGHVQAPFKPELQKFGLLSYTEWPWPDVAQVLAIDVTGAPIAGTVSTDGASNYHVIKLPPTPEIVFVQGRLFQMRLHALTAAPGNGQSTADINAASTAIADWVLDEVRNQRADLSDVSLPGYAADTAFVTTAMSQAQAQWVVTNSVPNVAAFVRGMFTGAGYTPKTLLYGQASTFAGNGAAASVNGAALGSSFKYPYGLTFDGAGQLLVAETQGQKIRSIGAGGGATSTVAGSGAAAFANGTGAAARFWNPSSVVVDAAGNRFVTDRSNNQIRKITPAGVVSTFAGSRTAGLADGAGAAARFYRPIGLAIDAAGNLYVGDTGNGAIRKVTPAGVVTTYAGDGSGVSGYVDGPAASARFNDPSGLAVDDLGNVLVADQFNYRVRAITPSGQVLTLAGNNGQRDLDGPAATAEFNRPSCITSDDRHYIYVADFSAGTVRRIGPTGTVRTLCGGPGFADGAGRTARFANPAGIARAPDGSLFIGDALNSRVRKVVLQH